MLTSFKTRDARAFYCRKYIKLEPLQQKIRLIIMEYYSDPGFTFTAATWLNRQYVSTEQQTLPTCITIYKVCVMIFSAPIRIADTASALTSYYRLINHVHLLIRIVNIAESCYKKDDLKSVLTRK